MKRAGTLVFALLATGSAAATPLTVHVVAAARAAYRPAVTVLGRLHGAQHLVLRAPYTALMGRWLVPMGTQAARGTLLARLWPVSQGRTVAALRAQAEAAASSLRNGRVLARQGLISGARLRSLEAAVARARAALASARVRLGHGFLRAPFAGTVRYLATPGSWLTPNEPVGTVDGSGHRYGTAELTQAQARAVGVGAPVRIAGQAGAPGRLYAFGAHLDQAGLVTAYMDGLATAKRPGSVLRLDILGRPRRAWRLPQTALVLHDGRPQIFRLVGNRAEPLAVRLRARRNGFVYVSGALHPGMRVVADHAARLAPGVTVRTVS